MTMYSVRIDKSAQGYDFKVEPIPDGVEMVALDSTPGVIAFVCADDPGAAAQLAWDRANHMHDFEPSRIGESVYLLGESEPQGAPQKPEGANTACLRCHMPCGSHARSCPKNPAYDVTPVYDEDTTKEADSTLPQPEPSK